MHNKYVCTKVRSAYVTFARRYTIHMSRMHDLRSIYVCTKVPVHMFVRKSTVHMLRLHEGAQYICLHEGAQYIC